MLSVASFGASVKMVFNSFAFIPHEVLATHVVLQIHKTNVCIQ